MRVKNLLMQLFVISPLTTIMGICVIGVTMPLWPDNQDMGLNGLLFSLIFFAVAVGISKLLLKIKGKTTETTYWDDRFEYELRDEGSSYALKKTRGGWTTSTKLGVFVYAIFAPVLIITRIVAIVFAFASLKKGSRFFSYYGPINYSEAGLNHVFWQKIMHFLFDVVIL